MREESIPFSSTRYALVLMARSTAKAAASLSAGPLFPTTANLASEERCKFKATSSKQAFASLSTRLGRRLSLPKSMVHSASVFATSAGVGALIVTVVVARSGLPRIIHHVACHHYYAWRNSGRV